MVAPPASQDAPARPAPEAPAGFEDWVVDLRCVADEGSTKLQSVWTASKPDYKRHLLRTNAPGWEAIKRIAAKVQS